jgi:hypothetical protein
MENWVFVAVDCPCLPLLFAKTVLFRNNTVIDVCQLSRGGAPIWTSVPRPDSTSLLSHVHADLRIEDNTFDTGPGPIFWLMDIHDVNIMSNVITYCSKVVVYPSGGVLNTSSNTGGIEFDLEDNELHAVDSPRLCAKTDDDAGEVPVVPVVSVRTRGNVVPVGTCAFLKHAPSLFSRRCCLCVGAAVFL